MMRIFLLSMTILAGLFLIYVETFPFPADIDPHNLDSGMKNAYKILGCIIGLWFAYEIDNKYIHFDTKAVWWAQILKLVLGLLPLLAIKALLKTPLYDLFDGHSIADGVRYFLIVVFAGCIWPMTFKFWSKFK